MKITVIMVCSTFLLAACSPTLDRQKAEALIDAQLPRSIYDESLAGIISMYVDPKRRCRRPYHGVIERELGAVFARDSGSLTAQPTGLAYNAAHRKLEDCLVTTSDISNVVGTKPFTGDFNDQPSKDVIHILIHLADVRISGITGLLVEGKTARLDFNVEVVGLTETDTGVPAISAGQARLELQDDGWRVASFQIDDDITRRARSSGEYAANHFIEFMASLQPRLVQAQEIGNQQAQLAALHARAMIDKDRFMNEIKNFAKLGSQPTSSHAYECRRARRFVQRGLTEFDLSANFIDIKKSTCRDEVMGEYRKGKFWLGSLKSIKFSSMSLRETVMDKEKTVIYRLDLMSSTTDFNFGGKAGSLDFASEQDRMSAAQVIVSARIAWEVSARSIQELRVPVKSDTWSEPYFTSGRYSVDHSGVTSFSARFDKGQETSTNFPGSSYVEFRGEGEVVLKRFHFDRKLRCVPDSRKPNIVTECPVASQSTNIDFNTAAMSATNSHSEKFRANNPNAVVLASGIQYVVLKRGQGSRPNIGSEVLVHYRGTLASNGREFDNSFARGTPEKFKLTHVVQGFREALERMSVGDRWKVYIPPERAYGASGNGSSIGPNEALVFEIQLINVE